MNPTIRPTADANTKATNGASPPGEHRVRTTAATSTAAQARRNWSLPIPWPSVSGSRPEVGHPDVGQGAEAQRDGRGPVVVDPGADAGQDDQQDADDRGEDAGQAVHVVARVGGPGDEGEQGGQDTAADETGGAGQLAAPQRVFAGHRGRDRLGHVVEHGGREGLGEGAQGEEFAVENALGGERAGAVEDGAVPAHQVIADRGALGGALPGEPEDLRIDVGDRDVVGQCHVDATVGRDDRDPAETEPRSGADRGSGTGPARRGGRDAHLLLPLNDDSASAS